MNYRRIALGLAVAVGLSVVCAATAEAGWGSRGSHGSFGSFGSNGCHGSYGSHGGSFGGMFSRGSFGSNGSFGSLGSHGSFGSHGGRHACCGNCCDDCGCEKCGCEKADSGCGCGGDASADEGEMKDEAPAAPEEKPADMQ